VRYGLTYATYVRDPIERFDLTELNPIATQLDLKISAPQELEVPINTENIIRGLNGDIVYDTQYMPDGTTVRVMVRPLHRAPSNEIVGVLQAAAPIAYIDQSAREVAVVLLFVSIALLVMAVAAAEATVGLAIVIAIYRNRRTPLVDEYSSMRE